MIREYFYYYLHKAYPEMLPVSGRNSRNFYLSEKDIHICFNSIIPHGATYNNTCFVHENENDGFVDNYFNYYLSNTEEDSMDQCFDYITDMYGIKNMRFDFPKIDYKAYYDQAYNNYIHRDQNNRCSFDDGWEQKYQLLKEYKKQYGNINIPKRVTYNGVNLGFWCQKQRGDRKSGKLIQSRIDKLEKVGFEWDPLETEWFRRYEQYTRYIKENGSPLITRRTDYEGEHLGAWIDTQIKWYISGKMSVERMNLLVKVNPDIFKKA